MPVLRWTTVLILAAWNPAVLAVGLGSIQMQSGIGQPLRASIPLVNAEQGELASACLKGRIDTLDGVFIEFPRIATSTTGNAPILLLSSRQSLNEPTLKISVDFGCTNPVHRTYDVLLDPPLATLVTPAATAVQSMRGDGRSETSAVPVPGMTDSSGARRLASRMRNSRSPRLATDLAPAKTAQASALAATAPAAPRAKAARSVLKLSSDEPVVSSSLRLSDTLSLPTAAAADTLPQPKEDMRIARMQFAALLRGDDPVASALKETEAAQADLKAAKTDAARLAQRSASEKAALENAVKSAYPSRVVTGLGALLLLSLATAGWLAWRLKQQRAATTEWWAAAHAQSDDQSEPEVSLERTTDIEQDAPVEQSPVTRPASEEKLASNVSLFNRAARKKKPGDDSFNPSDASDASSSSNSSDRSGLPSLEFANTDFHAFKDTLSIQPSASMPYYQGKMLKVEEISDVVQEAEFWMLLNDPQRALQILEPHSDVERPDSPVTWLYLIDLYRLVGDREKYQALAERFKRIFNARIPAWEDDPLNIEKASLEDFPGLIERISKIWETDRIIPMLEDLLFDDRDGERVGFDLPVYKEIIMLIGLAHENQRARQR